MSQLDPIYRAKVTGSKVRMGAFAGDKIVGFVTGDFFPNRALFEVTGLYTLDKFRRRKVGTRLLKVITHHAEKMGAQRLLVLDAQPDAKNLLFKEGARLNARGEKESKIIHSFFDTEGVKDVWDFGIEFKKSKRKNQKK